ncbi:MAG TPA: LLM class flavin-dependent oxidoreductase [Bacteriovoracaceae bacterium]|nr:LLM class flavin-dependent oxidoreductase [Bacteriovoracaceae bacterium]
MRLSVLDLCSVIDGEEPRKSFEYARDLAQAVESFGYTRYWVAEHHDSLGIVSSCPEVLIGHLAGHTQKMRIGSGGVMLPNHSTYHIAEIFRTLEALYPNRIDLGLGRAPGSGGRAIQALRPDHHEQAQRFPEEIDKLFLYFEDKLTLKAAPSINTKPEVWILGSSDFGARLAAQKGLPYSFAQHFSGRNAIEVMRFYKENFNPSPYLEKPNLIMGCHIICAESEEEADFLSLSSDVSMAYFIQKGQSMPLLKPEDAQQVGLTEEDRFYIRQSFPKFVGTPEKIKEELAPYSQYADELVISCMVYDQKKRINSYRLLSEVFKQNC